MARGVPALLILLTLGARVVAEGEGEDPFKGATKEVHDPEGRISVTVGDGWQDLPLSGNIIVSLRAPGNQGGHHLMIARETGQPDTEKQRERYLAYDAAQLPNGLVQKLSEPFFGYRINDESGNVVKMRAFLSEGDDGIVVSVSSRFQYFDKYYQDKVYFVVASVHATGAGKATGTAAEGEQRRLFDDRGRVSMVVPATWRKLPTETDNELLFVALKGIKGGPRLLVTDWGGPASAGLTLTKILSRWKRDYSSVVGEVLKGDPPRMLVRNRVPGSVDYLIAFAARDRGYTLGLTVSAGSYENYRTLADAVAGTIVFEGGAWHEPEIKGFDVETPHKKLVVVHSDNEHAAAASRVVKELPAFEKHWKRIGIGDAKHAPPLHVVVTTEEDFARASNYFGAAPAAYDPSACAVVVVTPPEGKDEYAMWNGQLYRALARAAIHRDFKSGVPPWIEAGLAACMDAAGRSGKGPDEANPALLPRLQLRASSDSARPLEEVFDLDANRVFRAETPDDLAVAWGYTHLMLFGKGTLGSLYKRWVKELEKAHGTWPVFDLKGYDQAAQDLKRHVEKLWGT